LTAQDPGVRWHLHARDCAGTSRQHTGWVQAEGPGIAGALAPSDRADRQGRVDETLRLVITVTVHGSQPGRYRGTPAGIGE